MKLLYWICIGILLVATIPLWLIIGFIIILYSGLPVFYTQKRTGKDGRTFTIYKFRTMARGADAMQHTLMRQNEAKGPVFKIHNDPRYTREGRFLAHTGLDELPQLVNVIMGDMALFGPRPLPVSEAKRLTSWQKARHGVKPGIMSPWILEGYHRQTFDAWMKSDVAYVKRKSFWYDLALAGRTISLLSGLFWQEVFPRH